MASIDELRNRIRIDELASRLNFKQAKGGSNGKTMFYAKRGSGDETNPSLSVFDDGRKWKDHAENLSGSLIDFVIYAGQAGDVKEAMRWLHEEYGIPFDSKAQPKEEKTLVDWIAQRCRENPEPMREYLQGRKIADDVIEHAIKQGAIGFNDWTSNKTPAGEPGHGGPAAAFIVRTLNPGKIVAVDLRYFDPALNGNVKTQCQGEKHGYGWTADIRRLMDAHTVYLVESPINALSVDSCHMHGSAAFAIRGVGNVDNIDFGFLQGKAVRICLDHTDKVNDKTGYRPGLQAAWALHNRLTALNISALFVDQDEWEEGVDLNDFLQAEGPAETQIALQHVEPWLIPGLPGRDGRTGKSRVFLPPHDFAQYWRFQVKPDFTSHITKIEEPDERDEAHGAREKIRWGDTCGFRVAGLSRVAIQSATATMTGDADSQPNVVFSVSVQTPRHGNKLLRRVFEDEALHNVDRWKRFGPIFAPAQFSRMVNILERTADIGSREAVNFVGLAWRAGRLAVNEGPDCYFSNPEQQCPYHNLSFPSGRLDDARKVIAAYQAMFRKNAATILLAWALGGHLKALLGFWPHMQLQANKGAGKSTLIKLLERSIAFTMFSGQSLQTEFRLLTSISHTSHPVGWEEISARRQEIIDKAVGLLQENYQYTISRRGSDMTEYLLSAPVLLAGEDVPVRSLIGKLVRSELTHKKGDIPPDDLPRFPVREWLKFLADMDKRAVRSRYNDLRRICLEDSVATGNDDGALRMVGNYAAVQLSWELLCEFAGIDVSTGGFLPDLMGEMNGHIRETSADREPWVWIMEIALSEIARVEFKFPYAWAKDFQTETGSEDVLLIRPSHIMDHIAHTGSLRDKWNAMPVKSDRVFKKQLIDAGVVVKDGVERTISNRRIPHLCAISLGKLQRFGLQATPVDKPAD